MKRLFSLFTIIALLFSCSTDDEIDFLVGEEFVYNAPDCTNTNPIGNSCFSSIRFADDSTAEYLPFGDVIYIIDYKAVDGIVRLKMSEYFGEGNDVRLRIESDDILIEIENEFEYISN